MRVLDPYARGMRPIVGVVTVASAGTTAVLALLVIRAVGYSGTSLAFVAAAIVGTSAALFVHHRSPTAELSTRIKAQIGVMLAVTAGGVGGLVQAVSGLFVFPEVVLPIAAVGSFLFPWAIAGTLWKALEQQRRK